MPFNVLNDKFIPVLRSRGASVTRETLSLVEVLAESSDIVALDVEPVFELGILDYSLALWQRAMSQAGMIPTDVGTDNEERARAALELLATIRDMTSAEKRTLLDTYLAPYADRFDITDRRNFGQSPAFTDFPKSTKNKNTTKSFYYARDIKHGSPVPLDAPHTALVLFGQRHTAIRGNHSVPEGSDVGMCIGTPNSGTLLLGPVAYVRGRTLWDTLLLQLTPDIMFAPEHDVPWWEKPVPTQVPDRTGSAITGPIGLLTHTPRLLLIDFDEQGTVVKAVATPGDLQTLEQRKKLEQKMAFFERVRTADNKDTGAKKGDKYISASPDFRESVDMYGKHRLLAWEGFSAVLAVGDTSSESGNRSLHWAACVLENLDMPESAGPVTIRTVTAVFDTKHGSKLNGVLANDLDIDLSLLMLDDPESLISARGSLVVSAVRNAMKVGHELKAFANSIHTEDAKRIKGDAPGTRLQHDFLLSLDPEFRKWVAEFPARPVSGEADTTAINRLFEWNRNLLQRAENAMLDYVASLPAGAWSTDNENRRVASVYAKRMAFMRKDIPVRAADGAPESSQEDTDK
jgi:hypothetical protein